MDTIRIRKLQFPVYLGVYDAEQEAPRPVVADIELGRDLARATVGKPGAVAGAETVEVSLERRR